MSEKKISVLMPNYNNAPFLKEALDSVFHQTYSNFEVIFVDDGSTDDSLEIARSYIDKRLRIIVKENNSGIVDTLNRGLKEINTTYFIRMDGDDIITPNRFEVLVRYLEEHPEIDVCSSAMKYFGVSNETVNFEKNPELNKAYLIFGHTIGHAPSIFRTAVFKQNSIQYEDLFWRIEDYLLFYRLKDVASTTSIDQVLYHYRRGDFNTNPALELKKNASFKNIYAFIFNDLGIEATSDRLAIHLELSGRTKPTFKTRDYEKHIRVLLQANNERKCFPEAELKQVLDKKMATIYYRLLDRKITAKSGQLSLLTKKPHLIPYFLKTRLKRL